MEFQDAIQDETIERNDTPPPAPKGTGKKHTFPKTIEIEITDEDNTVRMKQHLEVEFKIDAVKAKRAAATGQFAEELKSLQRQRADLINTIQSKKEKRDIDCYQEPDFRRNTMFIRRADTDEVIDERALTLEERQESLPLKPKTPEEAEADAAGDAAEAGEGSGGGGDDGVVDDDYKPEGKVTGGKASTAGKVTRIKAGGAKPKKAKKGAKGKR